MEAVATGTRRDLAPSPDGSPGVVVVVVTLLPVDSSGAGAGAGAIGSAGVTERVTRMGDNGLMAMIPGGEQIVGVKERGGARGQLFGISRAGETGGREGGVEMRWDGMG